jgi:hypothetical protein
MITNADKGNALVIIYRQEYDKKAEDFINSDNFSTLNRDHSQMFQKEIRKAITYCTTTTSKSSKWKLINLNPSPPQFHGLVKVNKTNMLIRPNINWRCAPAYKLAQHLVNILTIYIPLPCIFNIKNSVHLMKDLLQIPYNSHLGLASLDISNMYPNIPTKKLTPLITSLCN